MDRYWLLTWTLYGNWLPGDPRGSVTSVLEEPVSRHRNNTPGTPYDSDMPGLYQSAQALLKGAPIRFTPEHASLCWKQMQSTARYRGWHLLAGAIMSNHLHLVVGVPGDPDPATLIRDLKSYSSRVLNQKYGKPESGTWWTEGGSRRKLPDENAVQRAVLYVLNQKYALIASIGEQPNGEQQTGEQPNGERPASAG